MGAEEAGELAAFSRESESESEENEENELVGSSPTAGDSTLVHS